MSAQVASYNKKNPYLQQQVLTASPEKLILILYDLGLKWCRARERGKAGKVFIELIGCLDFDYGEVALGYFDLYRYALDEVHQGRFDNAIMVLENLREIWESSVMRQQRVKSA